MLLKSHPIVVYIIDQCNDDSSQSLRRHLPYNPINNKLSLPMAVFRPLRNSYTMGCPPVRGDNPRALASGLSYVQMDNPWYNYFIPPTPV